MEALREAFLHLLERKSIEHITIREITDAAGLSYPTFFRRFASKEELLQTIAADEVRVVLNLGSHAIDAAYPALSSAKLCAHVSHRRRLWRVLLTGGAAATMREEFLHAAEEIARTKPRVNPWIPMDLATSFTTSAIFEILSWWMRQPADYPIANVVQLFDALIIDTVARKRAVLLPETNTAEMPQRVNARKTKRGKRP